MEAVVPWQALLDLIEPHYPKTSKKGGRPPYPLATMRRFAGIDLISDRIPDETTILIFRHLLEQHELGEQIYCFAEDCVYETVKAHLSARGMTMRQGTIVDATLIAAPSSTSTRATPECAGGDRTKTVSGIPRCTRPGRATSGTTG